MTQGTRQDSISVEEAAAQLEVHPTTVTRWIRLGHIPGAFKAGPGVNSPYRIPRQSFEDFVQKLRGGNPQPPQ